MLCNIESKECTLHCCDKCPGTEMLKTSLEEQFKDFEPDDTLTFKQWVYTDRETLESLQLSAEDLKSISINFKSISFT